MTFLLPNNNRPKIQTDKITKRIKKTKDDEILKSVERTEICSPCDEDPLPTNVRNKAIHVRRAANPLNFLENGDTIIAAIAPIQTRTFRL
jgi:hypothetical protein